MTKAQDAYLEAKRRIAEDREATKLNLEIDGLEEIPPEISALTNLTVLSFSNTQIASVEPLASITNLTTLFLHNTRITSVEPLASLSNLITLDLDNTRITSVEPLSSLTSLTALYLHNTRITSVEPLSSLTSLTALYLDNTQITSVEPLSSLTNLTELDLGNTRVIDLRPIKGMQTKPESWRTGLSFKGCAATRIDPKIAEIAESEDNEQRALQLFAYLEDWEPPSEIGENSPQPDALLGVHEVDGKLEIAASHPSEAERDERLKQVLHERLIGRTADLARLAGNQFNILSGKTRALSAHLDMPFEDLDMLAIHLDVEELSNLGKRGAERDGNDPFPQEIADALDEVITIGPGLTLDNADVELLEKRKQRYAAEPMSAAVQTAHDDMSEAVVGNSEAVGDRLRALEQHILDREDDAAGAAAQDATHRNILIKIGRLALVGLGAVAAGVATTLISAPISEMIVTNWSTVMEIAASYEPGFKAWFLNAMSHVSELAGLIANVEKKPIKRPEDQDIDPK